MHFHDNFDIRWKWIQKDLLKRIHTKTLVHARGVGEEACDGSLEEQTEGENMIAHSLLEEGIASSFAND